MSKAHTKTKRKIKRNKKQQQQKQRLLVRCQLNKRSQKVHALRKTCSFSSNLRKSTMKAHTNATHIQWRRITYAHKQIERERETVEMYKATRRQDRVQQTHTKQIEIQHVESWHVIRKLEHIKYGFQHIGSVSLFLSVLRIVIVGMHFVRLAFTCYFHSCLAFLMNCTFEIENRQHFYLYFWCCS